MPFRQTSWSVLGPLNPEAELCSQLIERAGEPRVRALIGHNGSGRDMRPVGSGLHLSAGRLCGRRAARAALTAPEALPAASDSWLAACPAARPVLWPAFCIASLAEYLAFACSYSPPAESLTFETRFTAPPVPCDWIPRQVSRRTTSSRYPRGQFATLDGRRRHGGRAGWAKPARRTGGFQATNGYHETSRNPYKSSWASLSCCAVLPAGSMRDGPSGEHA